MTPNDTSPARRLRVLAVASVLACTTGCLADVGIDGATPDHKTTSDVASGNDLATLALANLGGTACGTNSLGGDSFFSSCTGNGGQPEYWCADFARWVWDNEGFDTSELSAAAGSFYVYGQNHGTLSSSPSLGAAVVFDYAGGGYADHVAIVTAVNADGTIESASGDWNGDSGTEAEFSSTSHVIRNAPAYDASVGSSPGVIGMTISGYITPAGASSGGSGGGGGGGGACSVHADGLLYCGNTPGASIYASTNAESGVVDHLRSNPSWFDCWSTGELHAGGNTTWYHTQGDDAGNWGWTAAVDLDTPSSFDADPSAQGLRSCN